jgi:hypothetical protein
VAFDTKAGVEIDAFNVDALLHHDACRKQRIETTGNQCNGFCLSGHGE